MKRSVIKKRIEAVTGNYSVTFKKQDGTTRHMLARQGVKHNLKGGKERKLPWNMLGTFDVDLFEYRTINLDSVTRLTLDDIIYRIV